MILKFIKYYKSQYYVFICLTSLFLLGCDNSRGPDGFSADLVVTGLMDDHTPARYKTWEWECNKPNCTYRVTINQNAEHTFAPTDPYTTQNRITQSSGDGTYYLHVQAKVTENEEEKVSIVTSVSAVLDNTPPEVVGLSNDTTPTASKTWNWNCNENDCFYRYIVNQTENYQFAEAHSFESTNTKTHTGVEGTYWLHVQAKDLAGNESSTRSVSAIFLESAIHISNSMEIEDGRDFTNKTKGLKVEFIDIDNEDNLKTMKIALEGELEKTVLRPYANPTTVDIAPTEDGLLTFEAELDDDDQSTPSVSLTAQITLDWTPPTAQLSGDLVSTEIKHYNKGDIINIEYSAMDPAPTNGSASGLAEQAVKLTTNSKGSCLSQYQGTPALQDWTASTENLQVAWTGSSIDHYICLYLRDNAGNISSFLSQPINTTWKVLAGNNNRGNSGSVTSKNVKFNFPKTLAQGPDNWVYVADEKFNTVRRFQPGGIIEAVAGSGEHGQAVEGSALDSSVPAPRHLAFDTDNNLYVLYGYRRIVKITPQNNLTVWLNDVRSGYISTMNIDPETNKMYIVRWIKGSTTISSIKLYEHTLTPSADKVTWNDFEHIAGNGMRSTSRPANGLAKSSPLVGLPRALFVKEGVIYLLSMDPQDLQKIYTRNGELVSEYFSPRYQSDDSGYGQPQQFFVRKKDNKELIYLASDTGIHKFDLKACTSSGSCLIENIGDQNVVGILPATHTSSNKFWISEVNKSQILLIDETGQVHQTYGREPYNENDVRAVSATLNNPMGVATDNDDNIHFIDSLNGVIRTIKPDGTIELLSGMPGQFNEEGVIPSSDWQNVATVEYYTKGLLEGPDYRYPLRYWFETDRLYFTSGLGMLPYTGPPQRFYELDLTSKKVRALSGYEVQTPNNEPSFVYNFTLSEPVNEQIPSVVLAKGRLLDPITSYIGRLYPPTGVSSILAGNGQQTNHPQEGVASEVSVGWPLAVRIFDGEVYFTGLNGKLMKIFRTRLTTGSQVTYRTRIQQVGHFLTTVNDMEILRYREGDSFYTSDRNSTTNFSDGNHVIGLTDSGLIHLHLLASNSRRRKLCFQGSFLNNPRSLTLSYNDRFLIISDTYNGRIIKYQIRDEKGNLILPFCP